MAERIATGGGLALVLLAVFVVGSAEAKVGKRYFILPGAGDRDAKVSLAVSGTRATSGYVLNNSGASCKAFPRSKGYFLDFGGARLEIGQFRDVDKGKLSSGPVRSYRDVVEGEVGKDTVDGSFRSVTKFNTGTCRHSKRFTLERVDRTRWQRYTKLARKIDENFNTDG